jgi:Phosphate-selective porin O and P
VRSTAWGLTAPCLLACCLMSVPPAAAQEPASVPATPPSVPATVPTVTDTPDDLGDLDQRIRDEVARQVAEQMAEKAKATEAARWTAGLNPRGGGAFLKSPDGKTLFRLYGYAQPTFTYTDEDNGASFEESDFRVRRARIDFTVDYDDRYKLFLEYDGAPSDGTALVEAWAQAAYIKGRHYVRAGKFITPFSTENTRSSRSLETVERYLALNAMFSLPGLDVQFGPMLWGHLDKAKKLTYFVGVWNGNASAGAGVVSGQRGNARDNNGDKEVQARLNFQATKELVVGAAFDASDEEPQTLTLASYSGGRFLALPVAGQRRGWNADAHWKRGRLSLETEWLSFDFEDSGLGLDGGYAQVAWWAKGSEDGGVQAVLRAESAALDGPPLQAIDGDTVQAVTLGANLWWGGHTRWQINAIGEHYDGRGNGSFRTGEGWRPTVLSQLQVKF